MTGLLIADIVYYVILLLVCIRIVYDTNSTVKTLAYLLLAIFVPVLGMLFYFIFGINYRKRKIYSKKLFQDEALRKSIHSQLKSSTIENLERFPEQYHDAGSLVHLLLKDSWSPLASGNRIRLLFNGEEKFPDLLRAIQNAEHHIHIQYYIVENDSIANTVKAALIEKARQGVEVRFIYDAFGSRPIRRRFARDLRDAGVEIYPFNKIRLPLLANRLNYRNHRRIIVIDGCTAYVGGINLSDRYINSPGNKRYWRDTHLRIDGPGSHYLQYLFFCDWNFCSGQQITPSREFFRDIQLPDANGNVQIAASGPDSPTPTIMLSLLRAIGLAKNEILITTPYFIPGDSLLDALQVAALGGVKVRLLVPYTSDSKLVNAAAWSYYTDLLKQGIEIYLYKKGFVHAKTMVIDDYLSVVGTANMDYRSFDLNFEVNVMVYGRATSSQLRNAFYRDIHDAVKIDYAAWINRPVLKQLSERFARLFSPLL